MDLMSPHGAEAFLTAARARRPMVEALLEDLVTLESPTGHPEAVRAVSERLVQALEAWGGQVRRVEAPGWGQHLDVWWTPRTGSAGSSSSSEVGSRGAPDPEDRDEARSGMGATPKPLLVVGHVDTVHPPGTLDRLPWRRVEGGGEVGRIEGPGVYDMKGGLAALVGAMGLLAEHGDSWGGRWPADRRVRILVTADEEVGSPHSRDLLEQVASMARGALVLEPPLPGGGMKIRRKGMAGWTVKVEGVPAHAGIEPEKGASAIHEMAGLLTDILALARPAEGTTVNIGTVQGGTTGNVVAERAEASVDIRFRSAGEGERVVRGMESLQVSDPRCRLVLDGEVNRGAMEPGARALGMAERALELARPLCQAAGRSAPFTGATGGGSDGNLISAAGCPVLDGLGPDGGGAHTLEEHILEDDLDYRIALYAALLKNL